MRENLNGELIIVTGASSGVGYAVARELVQQEGAIVVAVARRRVFRLEALARQLGQDKLFSVTADLSVPGEARRLAEQVKERWGTPSALVHAICRTLRAPALEVTDAELDLTIIVSPSFMHEPLAKVDKRRVVAEEKAFRLGDKTDKRVIDTEIALPKEVQNNGTLWGHFFIGLTGSTLDPKAPQYDPTKAVHFVHPLTQYLAKKKVVKTKNLLAATEEEEAEEEEL